MKLSVVIVNYNVKAFLEQCLRSVQKALEGLEGEVFVVDNQSTDGSVEMVRREFPQVKIIDNRVNVGFSRANNQAIRLCKGEYVLLLNPDTVVGEDVFSKVAAFMDANPRAGGVGVKMIDGTGRFLPESKRGLPTPTVAFFKIMGLARLFPHNKHFGRYHLGHLPENGTAPIEILSGACMFLRRSVLDQVGLLDESFFMYGEDIDLSYRILLGGHENWYFPEARIIHYKGESTKKSSVNYVFVFYNAMVIFARKHFTRRGPQFFSAIIRGAIYLSAAAALVARFISRAFLPLVDLCAMVGSLRLLRASNALGPGELLADAVAAAIIAACSAAFGAYDRPSRPQAMLFGAALAALLLMASGGAAGGWGFSNVPWLLLVSLVPVVIRWTGNWRQARKGNGPGPGKAVALAIGTPDETKVALDLLWQTHYGLRRRLSLDTGAVGTQALSGMIADLLRKERVDEVVFCAADMRMEHVIHLMEMLRGERATFKISQPGAAFIIGPGATESLQDLFILPDHAVNSAAARRLRKMLDLSIGLFMLVTLPACIWLVRERRAFIRNLGGILSGRLTWIGYAGDRPDRRMPRLDPGVLNPMMADRLQPAPTTLLRTNLEYAKDYRIWQDLRRIMRNLHRLGSTPGA